MSLFVTDGDEDQYQGDPVTHVELADDDNLINREEVNSTQAPHDERSNFGDALERNNQLPVVFEEPAAVPQFESREVSCNLPLKFQQEIVEDLLARDGLLLLARGLGWDSITANLLHALCSPTVLLKDGKTNSEKKGLIFLLNAGEEEVCRIKEELTELKWIDNMDEQYNLVEIGGDMQHTSSKRKKIYHSGGIISVTSRVLIVDLLSGLISPNDITGLFILHAERIRDTSNEAFAITLYRKQNDWGFLKAVSDDPESFTGFTPLASKLRILDLSNIFLWPRFHVEVSMSLNAHSKGSTNRSRNESQDRRFVTEINTKMSYKMSKIQSAILACIQACLQELKRHNMDLATEYWDMENVHDPGFVRRIRVSLESQWHRLTYTSKQLVYDLSTLTDLLKQLVTLDSISFYEIVQGIVDQNIKNNVPGSHGNVTMSPWLNLDESNTIIGYSRERALGKSKRNTSVTRDSENADNGIGSDTYTERSHEETEENYILEELPKWNELGILLDDIIHEKSLLQHSVQGPILIMCSTPNIARQLSNIISTMLMIEDPSTKRRFFSCKKFMVRTLHEYLTWKEVNSLAKKLKVELDGPEQTEEEPKEEQHLSISKSFTRNQPHTSKRRRVRGASATARVGRLFSGENGGKNITPVEIDTDILQKLDESVNSKLEEDSSNEGAENEGNGRDVSGSPVEILESRGSKGNGYIPPDDQIIVRCYNEKSEDALLQELAPSSIIMYEPDLSFIRRVEVYQAINKERSAKTYFMYYGNSVEEQKHLLKIKKEKEAFTRLIREKATLGKRFETDEDKARLRVRKENVVNTRIAGGANFRSENDEFKVIVDVREFRSALPNLLHRVGIDVVPCMLTVGDYVVTPKICVERKSIPDLISSFASGRLYNQCEQMFRHYETPALLIEFDESKSFSLEPFTESKFRKLNPTNPTTNQFLQQNIQSKIMSLLISFPKLKVIWSSSSHETAQIFMTLKANQEDPDVTEALYKGVNSEIVTEDGGPPVYNDDPIDFLQTIPGINSSNYPIVIRRIKSIEELSKTSKGDLIKLLGEENGPKVFNFFTYQVK